MPTPSIPHADRRSSPGRGIGVLGLAALATLAACAAPDEAATPAAVAVDFSVGESGLAITAVYPVAGFPIVQPDSPRRLRYELRDEAGRLIVAGILPDPRFVHSEQTELGEMRRSDTNQGFGAGSLRLPYQAGKLILIDPASGRGLGWADFQPATLTASRSSALRGRTRQGLSDGEGVSEITRFHGDLDPDAAVDLLFLPEGFTEDEMEEFHAAAEASLRDVLATADYAPYAARFNAMRIDVPSKESGIDDPESGAMLDTAFDFSFGDQREAEDGSIDCSGEAPSPRRGIFFKTQEAFDLATKMGQDAGADVVVVISNTEEWGGAATPGIFSLTRFPGAGGVIISHELGHALLGLEDEYPYGCCKSVEDLFGTHANVTDQTTASTIPWSDLLTSGIELPTPEGTRGVGAFEGAATCEAGMYRPASSCLMRERGASFCPVCSRELERFFGTFGQQEGGDADCPVTFRGDGICNLCLGDDDDCAADVCDDDGTCDIADGEDCSACASDCGACGVTECGWLQELGCSLGVGDCEGCGEAGCGDGDCYGAENAENCGADCGCGAVGACGGIAEDGCYCDTLCESDDSCCPDIEVCGF